MKLLQLGFMVGLLASGIVAELRIEKNADGSIKSVYETGTKMRVKKKRDACPVKGTTTLTTSFSTSTSSVSSFTDSLSVISDTFSSYTPIASPTSTSISMDASLTSTTSSPTSTATCAPPGSVCTVDNFTTACCTNPDGSVGCYFPDQDPQNGQCFL